MPRDPPTKAEDEDPNFWRGLGRDLLIAAIVVALVLVAIYAYAGVWPPLVVVESSSMQHGGQESFLGVIDTGDMVFQQAAQDRASVVTYLEGRAAGYQTYSDFGDVIIFRRSSNPTPVIHRAIMYIVLHPDGTADVPALAGLPESEWEGSDSFGQVTHNTTSLRYVTIHGMGYARDLGITFDLGAFAGSGRTEGYITMGDNNAYVYCSTSRDPCRPSVPYDQGWLVRQADIIGRARGEIPWFGLLKLTFSPTPSCCNGWGDREAPKNSWDLLLASILFLIALPFLMEYASRGWTKYVSPHMPKIRWPWRRRREERPARGSADPRGSRAEEDSGEPPREGSSGP
jgi:signal peptidase